MKFVKPVLKAIILFIMLFASGAYAQDYSNPVYSENKPSDAETNVPGEFEVQDEQLKSLTDQHKAALQRNDYLKAGEIESQINIRYRDENKIVTATREDLKPVVLDKDYAQQNSGDWMAQNSTVFSGNPKNNNLNHKQVDIKEGEDGVLYAAVNSASNGTNLGVVFVYKSFNQGLTWEFVTGAGYTYYIGNISLLVESRLNSNHDSTRVIIFLTLSASEDFSTSSSLNYISARRNGSAFKYGFISSPSAGKTFTGISAVSDGAYWEGATYYGIVATEAYLNTGQSYQTDYFLTLNWGSSWLSSALVSGLNDIYPSADYKEGSSDSLYIAVERSFTSIDKEIRLFASTWLPSPNFRTYYLTNSNYFIYEKPSLTIKQEGSADSMLITCLKNGNAVYHYTPDGSSHWFIDNQLSPGLAGNKSYTYCSSSKSGAKPFSACWVSDSGDSICVRRGNLGLMGQTIYDVNENLSLSNTRPVCATIGLPNSNTTIVAYASVSPNGVYATQEGLKQVNIKIIPQGFYNQATGLLEMKDTLRMYVRTIGPPYTIVDSGKSIIDSVSYAAQYQFTGLSDGEYYFSVEHRNSIETWTKLPVSLSITSVNDYNFTVSAGSAYGNNLIQVDNTPLRFAMYNGDVNKDDYIDLTDIVEIYNDSKNFETGYIVSDLTGDRICDLSDLTIAFNNSNAFVAAVKP